MTSHKLTKPEGWEQGHIGSRTLLVEHSGTKVERHVIEQGVRSPNFTNAKGDRPT